MLACVQLVRAGREPPFMSSLELGLAGVACREWEDKRREDRREDDVELILNVAMIFYLVNLLDYLIELDDFFILTKRYNL